MEPEVRGNRRFLPQGVPPGLRVFFVCLLISTAIWLLMVLSKDYTGELRVNLKWAGISQRQVVAPESGSHLELSVESQGFGLFRGERSLTRDSLILDLSEYSHRKTGNRVVVRSSELRKQIAEQLGSAVKITAIKPDSLVYYLCPIIQKELFVKPVVDFNDELNGLHPAEPESDPRRILVEGPSCLLDTMSYVRTDTARLDLRNRNKSVRILLPHKQLSSDLNNVEVSSSLFPWVEQERKVIVRGKNLPSGYRLKCFPDSVTVHFSAPANEAKLIRSTDFKLEVELPEDSINLFRVRSLPIQVTSQPKDIKDLRIELDRVEFVLLRN